MKQIDALEKELKAGGACGKNCGWILYSLFAGMCMGTGAFIYASTFSDHGIMATGILAPAPFIMCLIIRLQAEVRYKCKTGTWFKEGAASRARSPDGKVLWKSLIPLIANCLTNLGQLVVLSLGWKFAKASDMNQGVISTLLACASLINIIVFYFMFGEKISCLHVIGVVLLLACIVCISVAATAGSKEIEDFDEDASMGLS